MNVFQLILLIRQNKVMLPTDWKQTETPSVRTVERVVSVCRRNKELVGGAKRWQAAKGRPQGLAQGLLQGALSCLQHL